MKTHILDYDSLTIPAGYTDTIELLSKSGKLYCKDPGGIPTVVDAVHIDVVATEDLPAFAVVTSKGKNADSGIISGIGKVIGITDDAIPNGFSGTVTAIGQITNPAWTFVNGDVLFLNGTSLSTTAPSIGFTQRIATAKNNTTIDVDLGEPVLY